MESDQLKWDERYLLKPDADALPPDAFMVRNLHFLQGKTVLDIAGGHGRNAILLAHKGFELTVADISPIALNRLNIRTKELNIEIETLEIDLDDPSNLTNTFDVVICINFRPLEKLLHHIPKLLTDNGIFLWCSFNDVQAADMGFPIEKALKPNEFKSFFPDLQILHYERFEDQTGKRDGYVFRKII
jgi:2-polyprenyl-3-methyl-5-hydroxy-6-metoxy-1,4-benzoquinol methylase